MSLLCRYSDEEREIHLTIYMFPYIQILCYVRNMLKEWKILTFDGTFVVIGTKTLIFTYFGFMLVITTI